MICGPLDLELVSQQFRQPLAAGDDLLALYYCKQETVTIETAEGRRRLFVSFFCLIDVGGSSLHVPMTF